jgi:hypothetical protein
MPWSASRDVETAIATRTNAGASGRGATDISKSKWRRSARAEDFIRPVRYVRGLVGRALLSMEIRAAGLLLVTPTGDWVLEGSREFLTVLGDPHPDYDAAMFAVRTLGFIAGRRYEAMLEVILHPRNVQAGAVDAVVAMLGSSAAKLFRITYLADRCPRCGSPDRGALSVEGIAGAVCVHTPGQRSRSVSMLMHDRQTGSPLVCLRSAVGEERLARSGPRTVGLPRFIGQRRE